MCHDGTLAIIKAECTRVVHEEVDETVNDDVAQLSGGIMFVVFHDNVFMSLDLSFTTWAAGGEVREESLSVFSDGGMSSSHASEAGA